MVTLRIGLGLALLLPFWVAAIGWLSGRILGVRLGRLRAAFAATLGWLLGVISTAVVLNGEHVGAGYLFLIVCFFAVLATMPLAIVLQLLTYMTPVFYPISIVPGDFRLVVDLNPLTHYLHMFRAFTYQGSLVPLWEVVVVIGTSMGVLALGAWVFARSWRGAAVML